MVAHISRAEALVLDKPVRKLPDVLQRRAVVREKLLLVCRRLLLMTGVLALACGDALLGGGGICKAWPAADLIADLRFHH